MRMITEKELFRGQFPCEGWTIEKFSTIVGKGMTISDFLNNAILGIPEKVWIVLCSELMTVKEEEKFKIEFYKAIEIVCENTGLIKDERIQFMLSKVKRQLDIENCLFGAVAVAAEIKVTMWLTCLIVLKGIYSGD